MITVTTREELARARADATGTVGVVMTMGALHEGHASVIRAARAAADTVLVTIFVNPLQFGPNEDFDRYPRTLENDLALAAAEGAAVVFVPTRDVMYPTGEPAVRVNPGPLGEILEGASRPGFFHGVLTVVLKILHLTRPDLAFFGEKDYQQLVLIRTMCRDLDLPVRIIGVPTVREADGIARSSRNRYLAPEEREAALSLSRTLRAAAENPKTPFLGTGDVKLDYMVITDPDLGPAPSSGPARMLIAASVGATRLIDNVQVEIR